MKISSTFSKLKNFIKGQEADLGDLSEASPEMEAKVREIMAEFFFNELPSRISRFNNLIFDNLCQTENLIGLSFFKRIQNATKVKGLDKMLSEEFFKQVNKVFSKCEPFVMQETARADILNTLRSTLANKPALLDALKTETLRSAAVKAMFADFDFLAAKYGARNATTPEQLIEYVKIGKTAKNYTLNHDIGLTVLQNPHRNDEVMEFLAQYNNDFIVLKTIEDERVTSRALQLALVYGEESKYKRDIGLAVVRSRMCNEFVLYNAAQYNDVAVVSEVAKQSEDPETLISVVNYGRYSTRSRDIGMAVLNNPARNAEVSRKLAEYPNPYVLVELVNDEKSTPRILARALETAMNFQSDLDKFVVCSAIVKNKRATDVILKKIESSGVKEIAALVNKKGKTNEEKDESFFSLTRR